MREEILFVMNSEDYQVKKPYDIYASLLDN